MQCLRTLALALAALLVALGGMPAAALTVDQVVALKRAGVSDETIRQMIRTEIKVRAMGGVGVYTVQQKGGAEWIVYQAASPRGVVDYPWDPDQYYPQSGVARVAAALDARRASPSPGKAPVRAKGRAQSAAKGYTLHLASYKKEAGARKQVAELAKKGVQAKVQAVDLKDKGRWYRVVVGSFPARAQARAQGERLAKAGSIGSFRVIPR